VLEESTTTLLAELANLRTIVGRFSDFAKMPTPQLEPVDLNDVVQGALRLFETQLQAEDGPPIRLEKQLAADPLPVLADREQLGRAFKNLILNAMDAMSAGGTLTVRTRCQAEAVAIDVVDTGHGIQPESLNRIFDPFYTTKAAQKGTGLGLSVTYGIVLEHGGVIEVESQPGEGTRFHLEFPAARKAVHA
jgi:hypothetical protein